MRLLHDGGGIPHHIRAGTLRGAVGGVGKHGDLRIYAKEHGGFRGLDSDLRHLLGSAQYDVAILVQFILVGDVYGTVAHGELFVAADKNHTGGDEVCALPGLDQLKCGAYGIGGGVGCAAEQGIGQTFLYKHRTEVVWLEKQLAGFLSGGLALAKLNKIIHKLIHIGIRGRVDDLQTLDIEAALSSRRRDFIHIADEHRRDDTFLFQPRGGFKDARIGALCIYESAGVVFKTRDERVKHIGNCVLHSGVLRAYSSIGLCVLHSGGLCVLSCCGIIRPGRESQAQNQRKRQTQTHIFLQSFHNYAPPRGIM